MVVESLKWVPFNAPLEFGEEKKSQGLNSMSRVVALAWQCYFWPKISRCSRNCEQEHCHDGAAMSQSQIFRDDPSHSFTIHVQYSFVIIQNSKATITANFFCYRLDVFTGSAC